MAKRTSDITRVVNFFRSSNVETAEAIYGQVRDIMNERLAPAKAVRAAKRKASKKQEPSGPAAVEQKTA